MPPGAPLEGDLARRLPQRVTSTSSSPVANASRGARGRVLPQLQSTPASLPGPQPSPQQRARAAEHRPAPTVACGQGASEDGRGDSSPLMSTSGGRRCRKFRVEVDRLSKIRTAASKASFPGVVTPVVAPEGPHATDLGGTRGTEAGGTPTRIPGLWMLSPRDQRALPGALAGVRLPATPLRNARFRVRQRRIPNGWPTAQAGRPAPTRSPVKTSTSPKQRIRASYCSTDPTSIPGRCSWAALSSQARRTGENGAHAGRW